MNLQTMEIKELDKGVRLITINNPPANTLNQGVQDDVLKIVDKFSHDPTVRAIVFTSAHPKIFIAGADLNQVGGSGDSDEPIDPTDGVKQMQDCFNALENFPKPTIVAINGHALGGGCEFVLACDFRLMSRGTIGLTEVSLGLIPGAGGTQRMTKLLGSAKAKELMMLGKRINAEEAEDIGLIYKAVSEESLLDDAIALAEELAEGAVQAMGLIKESIHAADRTLDEGLKVEREAFVKTFATGETDEGLGAFFEKRKPDFIKAQQSVK